MGEMKIKLPDELEIAFRKAAMRRFGYQRGAMSAAAKEAIMQWSAIGNGMENEEDSWDSLEGIMKHVKKSSVELQHEAWDYITKKNIKKNANRQ